MGKDLSALDPSQVPLPPPQNSSSGKEHEDQGLIEAADEIIFHRNWDTVLRLETITGRITFKVISSHMASASAHWNSLLGGDSPEPQLGDIRIAVDLHDNAGALETLLWIIHYAFAKVPMEPSVDQSYHITRLTYKYHCTHLIYPWAKHWTHQLGRYEQNPDCAANSQKVAWIAWELGAVDLMKKMADVLVGSAKIDASGELVDAAGNKLNDLALLPGFLDRVAAIRTSTLTQMLAGTDELITYYAKMSKGGEIGKYCRIGQDMKQCEAMMFSSAISSFLGAAMIPIPNVSQFCKSIQDFVDLIQDIEIMHWVGKDYKPHRGHSSCDLPFLSSVLQVLSKMATPLEPGHYDHLVAQAAITGLEYDHDVLPVKATVSSIDANFDSRMDTQQVHASDVQLHDNSGLRSKAADFVMWSKNKGSNLENDVRNKSFGEQDDTKVVIQEESDETN